MRAMARSNISRYKTDSGYVKFEIYKSTLHCDRLGGSLCSSPLATNWGPMKSPL